MNSAPRIECAAGVLLAAWLSVMPLRAQQSLEAGDWFAACDNLGVCRVFGFAPAEDESLPWIGGEDEAVLELLIDGHSLRSVRIDAPAGAPPDRVWRIYVDDEPWHEVTAAEKLCPDDDTPALCEGVSLTEPGATERLLARLRRGGGVLTLTADGAPIAHVSLNGALEILARVASRSPVRSTPNSPRRGESKGWTPLPERELAGLLSAARSMPEAGECESPEEPLRSLPGEGFRHPDGTRLILLDCFSGPYNAVSLAFLVPPEGNALRALEPEWPEALSEEDREDFPRLVNANFDRERGELIIFSKFRGIGDCGRVAGWRYHEGAFHLFEFRKMGFCRGLLPDRWPHLWRETEPGG
jgi:hypothetical protein